ncbi:MAG: N-acetylneuraminate synthase family protein [Anaerolinea sp.]|nr:N-acetylneuraminate synthase family protein [Anaerolinea sp.]
MTLIIAEIGSVHDGSFGNAKRLIDAIAATGADVAKFQTHISEAETLRNAPMPSYFKGEPRFEYFKRTGYTRDQWAELKAHCEAQGVEFMSSPFSIQAVELLDSIGMKRWKIPSGEITNLPMLDVLAQTGKPVILSSGMSSWAEIDRAVETIRKHHDLLTVLQCTSEYPCPYDEVGLNVMLEMRERYNVPVGFSDHTLTIFAPIVAVTLGASVVEKHFTFSRLMYGSDARHSLEPGEFKQMVEGIRAAEIMTSARVDKDALVAKMREMKDIFEKSVVSVVDIPPDTVITGEMVAVKKPGTGIPARRLSEVIGSRSAKAIPKDTVLQEEDIHA